LGGQITGPFAVRVEQLLGRLRIPDELHAVCRRHRLTLHASAFSSLVANNSLKKGEWPTGFAIGIAIVSKIINPLRQIL